MSMNPIVLVTGANGALGTAVCKEFCLNNWSVYAVVRSNHDVDHLRDIGVKEVITADLTDQDSLLNSLHSLHLLHAVIHCAGGINAGRAIEETGIDAYTDMMNRNVLSTFAVMQCTIPKLKTEGGTFISVAAQSVILPATNKAVYSASKAAVVALTQGLAEEGRPFGVRAHTIIPGILRTAANLEWASNGESDSWIEPSDVAKTMVTLCSPQSKHITGLLVPMISSVG